MSTFKELQDRVLDGSKRAGLTDVTEIKSLINQVYLEMNALLRPEVVSVTKLLTVNDPDYTISGDWAITDLVALRHIQITDSGSNQVYLLEQVSPEYILLLRQTQSTSGGMMNLYALEGQDLVMFWPPPSSTTTNATITYVAREALLVGDGDVPDGIPVEFHDTIVLGALARALRIWNPRYAREYHADYRQGLLEFRQWRNRMGGAWSPKAIVRGARLRGPHDNSLDYSGWR